MVSAVSASPAGAIEPMLRAASASTGIPFDFLLDTAARESSFDPNARASTSSATGLFQFLESTWLEMIDRHGAEHGLASLADAVTRNADGSYAVPDPTTRRAILDLRTDPALSAVMAGELAADNAAYLQANLGRMPSSGELYIAHFLGAAGAANLISSASQSPDANASALFPLQAAANPGIFRSASGRERTLAEVYDALVSRHGSERPAETMLAFAAVAETPAPARTYSGFTASAPDTAFAALFRTDAPTSNSNQGALWSGFASARGLFAVAVAEDALAPSGAGLDLVLEPDPVGPLPTVDRPVAPPLDLRTLPVDAP